MNSLPGGQGGGLNAFKAGLATGGTTGGGRVGGGAPIMPGGPFTPPGSRPTPPQVSVALPQGPQAAMFAPGSTIHGKVAGQQNGQFMLRLGDLMLKADSRVPLKVGDAVQFQVQGENKGQVHLKLVSTPFEKMSMNDLSQTMTSMKMPMDEKNMTLAKTMVELKIPLTKENMSELQTSLAQTAPKGAEAANQAPLANRVAATSFLQNGQVPVTPQNVNALSNFMANNPQIGQQMLSLNTEFKKLNEFSSKMSKELTDMVGQVQAGMGKMTVGDPGKTKGGKESGGGKTMSALAQQAGMQEKGTNMGPGGFAGGEEWDFPAMLRRMRERASAEGVASKDLLALLEGLEQNIEAQRLINAASPESMIGYYYLQLPLNIEGFRHGEVWVQYTEEGEGRRRVDAEDTRIELFLMTDHMGELHFVIDIKQGKVCLDLGTPSHEVRQFAARYLPALAERIRALGWETGRFRSYFRAQTGGKRELVEQADFDNLERCNIHA